MITYMHCNHFELLSLSLSLTLSLSPLASGRRSTNAASPSSSGVCNSRLDETGQKVRGREREGGGREEEGCNRKDLLTFIIIVLLFI